MRRESLVGESRAIHSRHNFENAGMLNERQSLIARVEG